MVPALGDGADRCPRFDQAVHPDVVVSVSTTAISTNPGELHRMQILGTTTEPTLWGPFLLAFGESSAVTMILSSLGIMRLVRRQ
jgi:hypothetical protein